MISWTAAIMRRAEAETARILRTACVRVLKADHIASGHRIVWHLPGIGKLMCRKKDPAKLSFWIEAYKTKNNKGPYFVNIMRHPNFRRPGFEKLIRQKISYTTDHYIIQQNLHDKGRGFYNLSCYEQALDYLFAALGKLTPKTL